MGQTRGSLATTVRWFIAIATSISVRSWGVAWAGTPVPVVDSPRAREHNPAASQGYLAWARQTRSSDTSFVKPDGAPKIRLNRPGTGSLGVGLDGTTAVYDVFGNSGRGNGNLRMFDVLTETRSDPPAGVNTPQDEFRPSISGDWLLFTRDNFRTAGFDTYRIRMTLIQHVDERGARAREPPWAESLPAQQPGERGLGDVRVLRPSGVASPTARCPSTRSAPPRLTQIPNPDRQQYSSSVTSDGTVYFVRQRNSERWVCGRAGQVVRLPNGGGEALIATIPEGKDVFSTFALEESDASTTLLLGREPCRQSRIPRGGIFEIPERRYDHVISIGQVVSRMSGERVVSVCTNLGRASHPAGSLPNTRSNRNTASSATRSVSSRSRIR